MENHDDIMLRQPLTEVKCMYPPQPTNVHARGFQIQPEGNQVRVQLINLLGAQNVTWRDDSNVDQSLGTRGSGPTVWMAVSVRHVRQVVVLPVQAHYLVVLVLFPINAVLGKLVLGNVVSGDCFSGADAMLHVAERVKLAWRREMGATRVVGEAAEGVRVPPLHPGDCVAVNAREEQEMNESDVSTVIAPEAVVDLQALEERLPLRDEALDNVDPEAFDADVVNALAPDIRTAPKAAKMLHEFGDDKILDAVVATHTTGKPVDADDLAEEVRDCLRAVVVAGAKAEDEAGVSVDERVDDDLPMDKSYATW